jgi:hypothetical protein
VPKSGQELSQLLAVPVGQATGQALPGGFCMLLKLPYRFGDLRVQGRDVAAQPLEALLRVSRGGFDQLGDASVVEHCHRCPLDGRCPALCHGDPAHDHRTGT